MRYLHLHDNGVTVVDEPYMALQRLAEKPIWYFVLVSLVW